jgi:hypothetical protein
MQRIKVAGVEVALRMRCGKNQRGQALAEAQLAVVDFSIDGGDTRCIARQAFR